ncbi:MAG TPA: hypothetical protein PKW05_05055 [Anaerolineae bacterium]|nr:hypothetical protein [Anaerolineae bacterium]
MKYRPDIAQVVERYRQLYAATEPGAILVHVFVPPDGAVPYDLRDYGLPDAQENARFVDRYIANRECFLRGRLGVLDDYVPDIFIHHGIGIHSAYVAGDIEFSPDTSWSRPVIHDWSDLSRVVVAEDNPWLQVLEQTARLYAERLGGQAGIATFYHFSPLDMANALRGNQLFLDFYDAPEHVQRLLDLCTAAIMALEDRLWPIVGGVAGGTPLWGSWLPGHCIMMSEDVANLCKASDYPRWAAPWTQRVIDRYDGALIHNHALGLHDQPYIARLRGLRVLQISEDPNRERPLDHLEELIKTTGGVALQVYCRPDEIERAVALARGGKVILQTSTDDVATANEIVRYVRAHSLIH